MHRLGTAFRRWVLSTLVVPLVLSAASIATTFDLATATVADINAAFDAGALTSEKLTQLYLNRIAAYDQAGPKINSVITLNPHALDEARALDAERKSKGPRSPLHGLPVVIKDLIDVAGLPTTAGFKPFGSPVPPRDATVVARLRAAGALVIAKVSTWNWFGRDGFGPTHPIGVTLNPYNDKYITGGSSNGVGAAMASYFAAIGIGTDTGLSVQQPSSFCSLAGMVATQGLVSRAGIVPRGPTQDRAGPMCRSIYDVAVTLSVIAGWDAEDLGMFAGMGHFPAGDWSKQLGSGSLKGRRIGVLREMFSGTVDPEVREIFDRALDDMRKAGAVIVDPVLTGINLQKESSTSVVGVSQYELIPQGNVYLARLGEAAPFKSMQEFIEKAGRDTITTRYLNALELPPPDKSPDFLARYAGKIAIYDLIGALSDKFDLDGFVLPFWNSPPGLLTTRPPGAADEAGVAGSGGRSGSGDGPSGVAGSSGGSSSGGGSRGGGNNFTSTTGLPGIIIPGGYTKNNLPVGLQVTGKGFTDLKLLQVAYGIEQATKRRKPPESTPPLPGEKFEYSPPTMVAGAQ
jgi:amidase